MQYRGSFGSSQATYTAREPLLEKGGLIKTPNGDGAVYCQDAKTLVNLWGGCVSLWLQLPEAIVAGVYAPLIGDETLKDQIIWGVNFGDNYITSPGLYAALTPAGIEFTIWTGAGRYTILDTVSNIAAGTAFRIDFNWVSEPAGPRRSEAHMTLAINKTVTAERSLVVDGRQSLQGKNFWMLDTPTRSNGLTGGVLQRIETHNYSAPHIEMSSSSSSSHSSFSGSSMSYSSSSSISSPSVGSLIGGFIAHSLVGIVLP